MAGIVTRPDSNASVFHRADRPFHRTRRRSGRRGRPYSSVTTSRQCGIFVVKPSAWTFGSITIWASGIAVDEEDRPREAGVAGLPALREVAEPGEQLALVGVGAEAADRADPAASPAGPARRA